MGLGMTVLLPSGGDDLTLGGDGVKDLDVVDVGEWEEDVPGLDDDACIFLSLKPMIFDLTLLLRDCCLLFAVCGDLFESESFSSRGDSLGEAREEFTLVVALSLLYPLS